MELPQSHTLWKVVAPPPGWCEFGRSRANLVARIRSDCKVWPKPAQVRPAWVEPAPSLAPDEVELRPEIGKMWSELDRRQQSCKESGPCSPRSIDVAKISAGLGKLRHRVCWLCPVSNDFGPTSTNSRASSAKVGLGRVFGGFWPPTYHGQGRDRDARNPSVDVAPEVGTE